MSEVVDLEKRKRVRELAPNSPKLQQDLAVVKAWIDHENIKYEPRTGAFFWRHSSWPPARLGEYCWRATSAEGFPREAARLATILYALSLREQIVDDLRARVPLAGSAGPEARHAFLALMLGCEPAAIKIVEGTKAVGPGGKSVALAGLSSEGISVEGAFLNNSGRDSKGMDDRH